MVVESSGEDKGPSWTFLSRHAQVLLCLARRPDERMRVIAEELGVTERAIQRIVKDLEEAGYLSHTRVGRRNQYEIASDRPMRHPLVSHRDIRSLLDLLASAGDEVPVPDR